MRLALVGLAALIPACEGDETVAAYGASGRTWVLTELHGANFPARATLEFPDRGRIAGFGPCNSYSAEMTVPYPWFAAGPIAATRRACPDLAAETAYFGALAQATLSEVLGDVLILRDADGREMVFKGSD